MEDARRPAGEGGLGAEARVALRRLAQSYDFDAPYLPIYGATWRTEGPGEPAEETVVSVVRTSRNYAGEFESVLHFWLAALEEHADEVGDYELWDVLVDRASPSGAGVPAFQEHLRSTLAAGGFGAEEHIVDTVGLRWACVFVDSPEASAWAAWGPATYVAVFRTRPGLLGQHGGPR